MASAWAVPLSPNDPRQQLDGASSMLLNQRDSQPHALALNGLSFSSQFFKRNIVEQKIQKRVLQDPPGSDGNLVEQVAELIKKQMPDITDPNLAFCIAVSHFFPLTRSLPLHDIIVRPNAFVPVKYKTLTHTHACKRAAKSYRYVSTRRSIGSEHPHHRPPGM